MNAQSRYSSYLRRERRLVTTCVKNCLKKQKLNLSGFLVTDDGYELYVTYYGEDVSHDEICKRIDNLKFNQYVVSDVTYLERDVYIMLVPITEESMNGFVWNYVTSYFQFDKEIEALSAAIAVLERLIEPLGEKENEIMESYIKNTIK